MYRGLLPSLIQVNLVQHSISLETLAQHEYIVDYLYNRLRDYHKKIDAGHQFSMAMMLQKTAVLNLSFPIVIVINDK